MDWTTSTSHSAPPNSPAEPPRANPTSSRSPREHRGMDRVRTTRRRISLYRWHETAEVQGAPSGEPLHGWPRRGVVCDVDQTHRRRRGGWRSRSDRAVAHRHREVPIVRLLHHLANEGTIRRVSHRAFFFLVTHGGAAPFSCIPLAELLDRAPPNRPGSHREAGCPRVH